jgi:hypothetical protein
MIINGYSYVSPAAVSAISAVKKKIAQNTAALGLCNVQHGPTYISISYMPTSKNETSCAMHAQGGGGRLAD